MNVRQWPLLRIFSRWFESANNAIEGILHAAKTQRHLKFHLSAAFLVLLFGFAIGLEKGEFVIISIVTLLVIVAEMFNTAVENMVDLLAPELRREARIAKDVAAGAVLVSSLGAVISGYLVFWPHLTRIIKEGFHIHKHFPENVAVLALVVNLLAIILLKAFLGRGLPLRGGFPSGHAAVSFSIWISIVNLDSPEWVVFATLGMALVISLSRLITRIHNLREVVIGALTGCAVTSLLFWIFSM